MASKHHSQLRKPRPSAVGAAPRGRAAAPSAAPAARPAPSAASVVAASAAHACMLIAACHLDIVPFAGADPDLLAEVGKLEARPHPAGAVSDHALDSLLRHLEEARQLLQPGQAARRHREAASDSVRTMPQDPCEAAAHPRVGAHGAAGTTLAGSCPAAAAVTLYSSAWFHSLRRACVSYATTRPLIELACEASCHGLQPLGLEASLDLHAAHKYIRT